jgi:hypothetical protein
MSHIVDEVTAANKKYASSFGAKKDLALPPARGFAILACMDARPVAALVTMQFARWSFPTSCWERVSGLSSTIQIAAWSFSRTT